MSFEGTAGHARYLSERSGSLSVSSIEVKVEITGVYSVTGEPFEPVTTIIYVDSSTGIGSGSLLEVPVGVNHVLKATANFAGGGSETVLGLIEEVFEAKTAQGAADPSTTPCVKAMQSKAASSGKGLHQLPFEDYQNFASYVAKLHANDVPFSQITTDQLLAFDVNQGIPAALTVVPTTLTLVSGQTAQFAGIATDKNGIEILDATVEWTVAGEVGVIDAEGIFEAINPGAGSVVGTVANSSVTGLAYINVIATCLTDADCEDADPTTVDACLNPGTAAAICENALQVCGNGLLEGTEGCDDGNATTESCAYGEEFCLICAATCQEAEGATSYCGDGAIDEANGEVCDDGANNGMPNMCNVTCEAGTIAICGNGGAVESGETCDDGAETASCNADCTTASCGDGAINAAAGETCDDGASNGLPSMCNSTCDGTMAAVCGNSVIEAGEDCDDGAESASCNADCTAAACGDGIINAAAGETCDDGAGNGQPNMCNSSCGGTTSASCGNGSIEAGEDCDDAGESTACNIDCTAASCGDGAVNATAGETCDDGNATTENCAYGQTSCTVCDSSCNSAAGTTSYCGDGIWDESNESCDDGNAATEACAYGLESCTICDAFCQNGAGETSYCGDSVLDETNGEICDDGANNGQPNMCNVTCEATTAPICGNSVAEAGEDCDDGAESASCNADCTAASCGDGAVNATAGETCDDGASNGQPNACNATCDGTTASICGNSVAEAGEDCDDGGESATCNADCTAAACGDGITNAAASETCDDGNTTTEACIYGQTSCTVCDATCQSIAGSASFCGDAVLDGANGEACDTTDLGGASCTSQGFAIGSLACLVDCTFDTSNCSTCGNSAIEGSETCDDGGESASCNANCTAASCGDGAINATAGETCDDGGSNGTVGMCNATCDGITLEAPGKISISSFNGCFVTSGGGAKCSGDNTYGQIGNGTANSSLVPVDVFGLTSGVSFIATSQHRTTCAITTGGGVKCWGSNALGSVGDGTLVDKSTPVDVTGLTSGVVSLAAGASHTCALTDAGGVKCWGNNSTGELGIGGGGNSSVPVDVIGLTSGVKKISGTAWVVCALLDTGDVKCWGQGGTCQLGNGSNSGNAGSPVNVIGLPAGGIVDIAAAYNYACALTNTGGVKCWGGNSNGQLGTGAVSSMECAPVDVAGLTSGVAAIYAGNTTTCAIMETGGMKCWGDNSWGQLGDGGTTMQPTPIDVTGLTSGVLGVVTGGNSGSGGGSHTCAVTASQLKCWGRNNLGQIGDGTATQRLTPYNFSSWPMP